MSEHDAIAIVGLACRLPSAPDPAALWRLLSEGQDAIAPRAGDAGRPAGLGDTVADFDAAFFGVAPHEAVAMDPQQRLALELAWESFEDAGHDPARWRDGEVGVFAAVADGGYGDRLRAAGDEPLPGTAASRVSEFFGFRGASMVFEHGAGASLVAVHQACESLRNEECRLALAGGVSLVLGHPVGDRGEGGGMVVLRQARRRRRRRRPDPRRHPRQRGAQRCG